MKPKIAIITRTKNRPIFLARALSSIAKQSYTDYIHVIVNDGGDRDSINDMIEKLPAIQKDRTRVFHRETSSNAPDTIFNESIDYVDSEYFAIHDDDDTWHPDFLRLTVEILDSMHTKAAVVVRTDKVTEVVTRGHIQEKKKSRYMPNLQVISLYRQCIDNQFTPIATLFRRSCYQKVGKFDSTLPVVGDWEFGIRLLETFDAEYLDPGYSLAYYHHRVSRDNSFAVHDHRYYTNLVMNRYLRQELSEGRIGVGYIMSNLKYEQGRLHGVVKAFLPKFIIKVLKERK